MGIIRFSDGMAFNTTGEYRIERSRDGLYVLGGNMMFAIDTREEGIEEIRKLDPKAPIVLRYDEAKAKKPREFFDVGCKYKIIEEGGMEEAMLVRECHNDISFLRFYLDEEFMRDNNYFSYFCRSVIFYYCGRIKTSIWRSL